jgi:hypothetical protein
MIRIIKSIHGYVPFIKTRACVIPAVFRSAVTILSV